MSPSLQHRKRRVNWALKIIFPALSCLLPGLLLGWDAALYWSHRVSIALVLLTYLASDFSLNRVLYFPGYQTKIYIFPTVAVWAGLGLILIMYLRLPYSRSFVLLGVLFTLLFILLDFLVNSPKNKTFAYIDLPGDSDYTKLNLGHIKAIHTPKLARHPDFDYLIVDLASDQLNAEWLKFISAASLKGIPVLDAKHLVESYTGRVPLDHLAENELGTLEPSYGYSRLKRGLDILFVLLTLPLLLVVVLIVTLIIRLESKGPAIFTQKRVGQYGREFKIYKFRSMIHDAETEGAKFAAHKDERVTPFGKFIRKFRIDELPQFFNILKGDMSLIGPRPEQQTFVTQFEKQIPFYSYRHVVKPGISGWAQVNQGYAATTEETYTKTEYDFFYIKYFSFSLDLLIVLKTLKTIFTGFGSR